MPRYRLRQDGFMPLEEAAEQMDVSAAALRELAARGFVECVDARGELWVRPAVVTILGVVSGP